MLLHILATSEAVGVFFLNCKRMRIKLISFGCNCFVRHFD